MCVERKENRCAAEGWSCTSRGSAKAWLRGVGFVASESFSFRVWRLRLFFDITSSTCMLQHCSQPGAQPVRLQSFKQSNNKKKKQSSTPITGFQIADFRRLHACNRLLTDANTHGLRAKLFKPFTQGHCYDQSPLPQVQARISSPDEISLEAPPSMAEILDVIELARLRHTCRTHLQACLHEAVKWTSHFTAR